MIAVFLMLTALPDDALFKTYRGKTAVETGCRISRDSTDITICGRRAVGQRKPAP